MLQLLFCCCCLYTCKHQCDRLRDVEKSKRWKWSRYRVKVDNISALISALPCHEPPPSKESRSMRQQAALASLWWREIYDHCHWDCVSTGHSTPWPSPSPHTQAQRDKHPHSNAPCLFLVIWCYQPLNYWFKKLLAGRKIQKHHMMCLKPTICYDPKINSILVVKYWYLTWFCSDY